jgi:Sulfotransferase family
MRPEQLPRLRKYSTFVLPQWKLIYVSNPKAGCTTIKWMLAALQGIDEEVFLSSVMPETTRATTIHRRIRAWRPTTRRLGDLSTAELAKVTPANGWFVFSMTRHPAERLWSAWQSKLLLREPVFAARFAGEPWLPRIPATTDQIVEDWEVFIRTVVANPDLTIMADQHFRSQSILLNIAEEPADRFYDRLYDTSEFKVMLDDLRAHLEAQGWRGELTARRSNETPLPTIERAFPPHVLDAIATVYAPDFRRLGYDSVAPARMQAGDYSASLVAAAASLAERNDRIGDLSDEARKLRQQLALARGPRSLRRQLRPALRRQVRRALGR